MPSSLHKVVWEIHTTGKKTAREAAQEAVEIMHDPESTALVFDVYTLDEDYRIMEHQRIDLCEEENNE